MGNAAWATAGRRAGEISGRAGAGRAVGSSGKRDPIVSTGICRRATTALASTTAIRKPGRRGAHFRNAMMRTREPTPIARVASCRLPRSEEHTSELQSLMRISYAVFCLTKKKQKKPTAGKRTKVQIKQVMSRRKHKNAV